MSNEPRYDRIGQGYATHRPPDPRVTDVIRQGLGLAEGSHIVDIGAGTGKYSRALADCGFNLHAVEPSGAMIEQSPPHDKVTFYHAGASSLPLEDGAAQGAFCAFSISHFPDVALAMREIERVTNRGPLVVVTIDWRAGEEYWWKDYFPGILEANNRRLPPVTERAAVIEAALERPVAIEAFPIPADFVDRFAGASWQEPAWVLDPRVQACSTSFDLVSKEERDAASTRLRDDLASGAFEDKYGAIRNRETFDVGLRVLRVAAG